MCLPRSFFFLGISIMMCKGEMPMTLRPQEWAFVFNGARQKCFFALTKIADRLLTPPTQN